MCLSTAGRQDWGRRGRQTRSTCMEGQHATDPHTEVERDVSSLPGPSCTCLTRSKVPPRNRRQIATRNVRDSPTILHPILHLPLSSLSGPQRRRIHRDGRQPHDTIKQFKLCVYQLLGDKTGGDGGGRRGQHVWRGSMLPTRTRRWSVMCRPFQVALAHV